MSLKILVQLPINIGVAINPNIISKIWVLFNLL